MIRLPEAIVITRQINKILGGKRIAQAVAGVPLHKFASYKGQPAF